MIAAQHRVPAEPADSPINAMVDLAEGAVRTCCEHGAEEALRHRLARLLPAPPPAVTAAHSSTAPSAPSPTAWVWAIIAAALRGARLPAGEADQARAIVARHLAAANAATRVSQPASPSTGADV